jgi:diadenosine tetraphosphate (Ap4A) HIT family hydrolase
VTTLFTRIIAGELPGHFVHREDDAVVFMTINPIAHGHALVVPTAEVDQWTDLDPSTRTRLFDIAHAVGEAQKKAFRCERVGLIIAGFEVPHCHIHVIPANGMGDVSFANAASHVDPDELRTAAESIARHLTLSS